ncbi:sulfotransferase family 2 domain-containing protein [Halobacillus sp. K22]|uniref:sulfotransferase family 2 domain-containing protein n=1 Tax=Halobacillus sp. K22 TaxID=3457431 RepID=UPI003FCEC870
MIHFNKEDLDQEKLICFIHVPKTGGRTLWNLLDKQKVDIIVRHGTFFKKLNKPTTYFTMLRDPVDRVISTYFYMKSYEREPLLEQMQNVTLKEFVDYMGREDLGDRPFHKKDLRNIRFRTVNMATRYLSGGDPNDYKKALKNMNDEMAFVGITDYYNESLYMLEKQFEWFHVKDMKKVNVTSKRLKVNEIPDDLIKEIKRLNDLDIKLYNKAKRDFISKLESFSADELKHLKKWKAAKGL